MTRDPRRDSRRDYDRARDAFDDLDAEGQARFLAETTVAAVSRGVETVSRTLAGELENLFGHAPASEEEDAREPSAEPSRGPGPAEPPTGAQRFSD